MTVLRSTFWYTVYTCDLCGAETDDPWTDAEGDDLCDHCAKNFIGSFAYLMGIEQAQIMRKRKHAILEVEA